MRKFITFVILVFSCFVVGCNKPDEPFVDSIENIVVCSEFYEEVFYVGDNIELNDYSATATYKSGKTEVFNLSSLGLYVLNTTSVGNKTLTLTYKEKEFTINYSVLDIEPINATYKGNALVVYRGENCNFENNVVNVLFNNGHEAEVDLSKFMIGEINYSPSADIKTFTATYGNVSVNIPYVVTNRPIEDNVDYNLTFTKKINAKEQGIVNRCPTCRAPLSVNTSGVCEYCGSTYNQEDYDWVLTKLEVC